MKINIDTNKYNSLKEKSSQIAQSIKKQKDELDSVQKEIKNLFPKGYWWAFGIDKYWNKPKKYSIKEVYDGYVIVKEVFKKAPWPGFDGLTRISFEDLFKLDICKTEEEAKVAAYNRICPKCGGPMKFTTDVWCTKCIFDRCDRANEYRKNHTFYDQNGKTVYTVEYTDELTRNKGFGGKHFTFKRLDTGEIIETDNLWSSYGADGNRYVSALPIWL